MERLTTEQRREIAVALGHGLVKIEPTSTGKRWQLSCSCGWGAPQERNGNAPSVTCATEREAASRAVHHVKSAVDRWLVSRAKDGASPFGLDRVSQVAG